MPGRLLIRIQDSAREAGLADVDHEAAVEHLRPHAEVLARDAWGALRATATLILRDGDEQAAHLAWLRDSAGVRDLIAELQAVGPAVTEAAAQDEAMRQHLRDAVAGLGRAVVALGQHALPILVRALADEAED